MDSSTLHHEAPDTAPDAAAVNGALFAEQVRLVYRNALVAIGGQIGNALVLGYVLWGQVDGTALVGWLAAIALLSAVRLAGWAAYRRSPQALSTLQWARLYWLGTALSGGLWALTAVTIFPAQGMVYQLFIAFVIGGLSAGALAAYAALPWLAHTFFLPATLAYAARLATEQGEIALIMAGLIALFAALLSVIARNVHNTLLTALRLQMENRGLVAYLTTAKEDAERLNRELTQEIREREQYSAALAESEERFRALVENATDGIGLVLDGHLRYANRAALELVGYDASELIGQPIDTFLADTIIGRELLLQRFQDRVAGKAVPNQYEAQLQRKDGAVIDVIISASLVHLEGKPGVIAMTKDITERKRAELELLAAKEQAEEATRLKDQFVSLLAHDLRSPLASMYATLSVLGTDTEHPLNARQQSMLQSVVERGQATLAMIEDLLSVSRIHAGKLQPERRFVDAAPLVRDVVRLFAEQAEAKGITLQNEVAPRTRLYTDPDLFGKVLNNLVSNSVKFCRRGDTVRVFMSDERPGTVTVADTGPGVAEELREDLFRHDVRTTLAGSAGERGTGLGLPLSQDLMVALGGEIAFESTAGEGATFHAHLPHLRPRVLLVSADEALGMLVQPQLERMDATLLRAHTAEEALPLLEREEVHLVVVSDAGSPDGEFPIVRRLREQLGARYVPLLLVTDGQHPGLLERGFRTGADDIVVKPFVPDDFAGRLRRHIV